MAKLWYEPKVGGTELHTWNDPQVLVQADIVDQQAAFAEVRTLGPELRTALANSGIPGLGVSGGWPDLESFDAYLEDEDDRLNDLLDYFAYDSRVENLTVRDGDWFVPQAIEAFSAENVGEEAVLSVDGNNGTWWQTNGAGDITFLVRDYRKMLTGLRLRTTSGDLRAQIQGVDISASPGPNGVDDPTNLLDSGINFTYGGNAWMEHTFSSKKRARYLKLVIPGSLNGAGHVRIREINIRVGITNHDK